MKPTLLLRRRAFLTAGLGLGAAALHWLLHREKSATSMGEPDDDVSPVMPPNAHVPHFPAKARSVIYLFMAGGPSQLDLFEYKPRLRQLDGTQAPDSLLHGQRFAFMDLFAGERPRLLGPTRRFARHGQSGAWVSNALPHLARVTDQLTFVHGVSTDAINHAPAILLANTGSEQIGRPSMGAWVTYGLGSETADLPAFVVLRSGESGVPGGAPNWGAGFLPAEHQGVPFAPSGAPVLDLARPTGVTGGQQRRTLGLLRDLNEVHQADVGDPTIAARIAAYELAYRMQAAAPDAVDLSREDQATLDRYGARPGEPSFASNCLMARRLVERGVRFVQLYHANWDHHGTVGFDLADALARRCREIDQASAALIEDLKLRGLLDDTLVIWGGEFGRTPMAEPRALLGRNHHRGSGTIWLAGGGVKPGLTYGGTDELGFFADKTIHMHDIQATVLHLLGLDHRRLTFRYQGRDFRLTDTEGNVLRRILA